MSPHLKAFRDKVCARAKEVDASDELDWFALSIGFFLARGLSMDKAHELALLARYTHHYWME